MQELLDTFRHGFDDYLAPVIFIIAGGLTREWWAKQQKRKKQLRVVDHVKQDREIYRILTECRIRLDAQIVHLSKFFNGAFYDDGSSIQRYQRTHESVADGYAEEAHIYDNVLVSLMREELELVEEDGPSFRLVADLQDGKFRRLLKASDKKSIARCAVRRGKEIIGFVGASFRDRVTPPENIDELCKAAGSIEQILARN